ncbi:MAG: hypothetical protein ACQXXL_04495 [Candidatus Methanosuratincola sp.]|jgi:predicted nucleic acid-binding protein|nr:hypothetical protein [Candidatus Methanosuratincola sp.]
MKGKYVVDTGPMLLYFAGDLEVKSIFREIAGGRVEGYTCETNLAEFYYKTCERFGRETAAVREASFRSSGLSDPYGSAPNTYGRGAKMQAQGDVLSG